MEDSPTKKKPPDEDRDVKSTTIIHTESVVKKGIKKKQFAQKTKTSVAPKSVFQLIESSLPRCLSFISIQRSIQPSVIPVSFRAIPSFCKRFWDYLSHHGTAAFLRLNTDDNFKIFTKVFLFICEAKICYAQINCHNVPPQPLNSLLQFSENQLRRLVVVSSRLPRSLIYIVDSIGVFTINDQPVVPILLTTRDLRTSGAVNYAPSAISTLCKLLADPQPTASISALVSEMNTIPGVAWIGSGQEPNRSTQMHPDSVTFWTNFPSNQEFQLFTKIVSSLNAMGESFNLLCDIQSGDGAALQAVRFPGKFEYSTSEVKYYMNAAVPRFDEQFAAAIQLGFEHRGIAVSRFCGSYDQALKRGQAVPEVSAHAAIWPLSS